MRPCDCRRPTSQPCAGQGPRRPRRRAPHPRPDLPGHRRHARLPQPGHRYAIIGHALAAHEAENVEELRRVELDRIDALQVALWERALNGDVDAASEVRRLIECRVKVLGLVGNRAPDAADPHGCRTVVCRLFRIEGVGRSGALPTPSFGKSPETPVRALELGSAFPGRPVRPGAAGTAGHQARQAPWAPSGPARRADHAALPGQVRECPSNASVDVRLVAEPDRSPGSGSHSRT